MKKTGFHKKTAREIACILLARIENKGAYIDRLLVSDKVMGLDPRDRAFIRELLPGVLRWKLRLDRIIDVYYNKTSSGLDNDIRNIVRLGLFQIMFMNSVPEWAAVNESVESAIKIRGKGAGGLVNALLRRYIREGEPKEWPSDPVEKMAFELSHPMWIVKKWIEKYGFETAGAIMKSGVEKHPVFVRPGKIGIGIDELADTLTHEGYEVTVVPEMSGYLAVSKGSRLFDTVAFKEGLLTVQDPSAGMASLLLSPESGENVLDLCAAPGGKTTHLALLMKDSGHIKAVDIHSHRLELIKDTVKRLGLKSVECTEGDVTGLRNETGVFYNRVLLDVPCTGTAVLSKRPDLKWRVTREDVLRLASLQQEMLHSAASMVKPGGILVYSTCSLEPEENEDTIALFLAKHLEFVVDRDNRFDRYEKNSGYLILPHQMFGSGAFASKLRKK
ncbi:MAG: 16S rRNA (cytosine(967)-C(5))-methyltransferase RsmB [Candidatus Latescibacteria bacterium]|nr:16S rRNA (cytosine(967)-C(5))-methyltransferase RsmB [Candidatus Latescibacterota bacterium]